MKIQRFWEVCYVGGEEISYQPSFRAAMLAAEALKRKNVTREVRITPYVWPESEKEPVPGEPEVL